MDNHKHLTYRIYAKEHKKNGEKYQGWLVI